MRAKKSPVNLLSKPRRESLDLCYCMDRLIPQRRGRPLGIQLPPVKSAQDIGPAIAAITNELNNGNLTLEEASDYSGLLESFGRAIIGR
jgi:hypothetical protein